MSEKIITLVADWVDQIYGGLPDEFEQLKEQIRKAEALITQKQMELLETIYQNSKYGEDKTAKEVQDRIEAVITKRKEEL